VTEDRYQQRRLVCHPRRDYWRDWQSGWICQCHPGRSESKRSSTWLAFSLF